MKNYLAISGLILLSFAGILSCNNNLGLHNQPIKAGEWRGVIAIQGQELPFNFTVAYDTSSVPVITIKNAKERLVLDEIEIIDDSLIIPLFIFDASLHLKILAEDRLAGAYIKHDASQPYKIPVTAVLGTARFNGTKSTDSSMHEAISGKWAITFDRKDGSISKGIAVLEATAEGILTGSILKTTGDYRFLEGHIEQDGTMRLSTFDGAHTYLFEAKLDPETGQITDGTFWSGMSREEQFSAVKDSAIVLPDVETLTYLKEGYDKFNFSFPDLTGELVSLEDSRFEGKAVIVQIFGTWCPNCMDETRFLTNWYAENKERGIEIIALAYEAKDDFDYAVSRVVRMQAKMNPGYGFLIGGTYRNDAASKTLPMLNRVVAFPTMIILDQNHDIVTIHTGFNGPGTGEYYAEFVEDFKATMNGILK
jgi:thiol-disulfide isomerase/thioredoxin